MIFLYLSSYLGIIVLYNLKKLMVKVLYFNDIDNLQYLNEKNNLLFQKKKWQFQSCELYREDENKT